MKCLFSPHPFFKRKALGTRLHIALKGISWQSCAAVGFKPRPCLRQKFLPLLPCLRQETLISHPDLFCIQNQVIFHTKIVEIDIQKKKILVSQIETAHHKSLNSLKGFQSKKTPCSRSLMVKLYTLFKTQDLVNHTLRNFCLFKVKHTNLALDHFSLTAKFVDNTLLDLQNSSYSTQPPNYSNQILEQKSTSPGRFFFLMFCTE